GAFPMDAPTAANVWRSLGPDGGLVQTLAIDPSNPTTIYAGTWSGGVFKTTNGGASWRAVNIGLRRRNVRGVAIDPAQASILYAATTSFGQGGGVFKSINGGESWVEANNGLQLGSTNKSVDVVAIDPLVTTTLYAGGNYRLFKSTDTGASWVSS